MIFLIFIVAYHHWRVFVISYWLRGAGDSLIACMLCQGSPEQLPTLFASTKFYQNIETNFALDLLIDRNNVLYMYCKKNYWKKNELRTVQTANQI